MINRKKINTSRYLAAFSLTIIVFLLGYLIGAWIMSDKLDKINYMEQDIRIQSLSNEIIFQLVEHDLCKEVNMKAYTLELSNIGKKLTYLESLYGYDSPKVVNLKNYYSLLQIRHFMLFQKINERCNQSEPLVLYFYSNYGCSDCEDQGFVLSNIYSQYPFFNIYSFEFKLNNSAINYLTSIYGISEDRLPTLVIDDDVYYGFQSKNSLIDVMHLEQKQLEKIVK